MVRTLALLLALAPTALAADLWVGPAGSGLPFTEIQAAVDAAQAGDRVYVLAGDYGPVTITKPIQLSGEGAGLTRIVGLADAGGLGRPALTVDGGVSVFQRVWLNGIEFAVDDAATVPAQHVVELRNVAGSVEMVDLKIVRDDLDATAPGGAGAYLFVEDCPRVLASDVFVVTGQDSELAGAPVEPFCALRASNSTVTLSDCWMDAARTPAAAPGVQLDGSPAIDLVDSTLWLGFTNVTAGDRGDQGADPGVVGGAGIRAVNSEVIVHGGKSNGVAGGASNHANGPGVVAAGPAIQLDATSSLVYGSDVFLFGGSGPNNSEAPAVDAAPGASVDARPDRLPIMWVQDPIGKLGTTATVELEGDPGAIHLWWLALGTDPGLTVPGIQGIWFMDPWVIHHPAVPMDSNGRGQDFAPIGFATGLLGLALTYQSLELDGGNLQIAPPWFATVEIY